MKCDFLYKFSSGNSTISKRFNFAISCYFKVCFSLVGPFKNQIRLHLNHIYSYNTTHDSTRSSGVTFDFEPMNDVSRITCFDMLYHLQNSQYLLNNRKMKERSHLHVYKIEFLRDHSVHHLDFVEDLFVDNFWIGNPGCAEQCQPDQPLSKCAGKPCMGLTGTEINF